MIANTNLEPSDRRMDGDRRQYSLTTLVKCMVNPRRSAGRRTQDRRYPVTDVFDSSVLTLVVLMLCFSLLDALFTLTLLSHGGTELNPVMRYFLEIGGSTAFLIAKLVLTAVPAIILVATSNLLVFGRWRVRSILAALVGGYAGLLVYELVLLSSI
ncbi:MAG: hypothetical protein KTR32_03330 [Granulosicoccus sp.]|nr:hypothetical protein [Granulosicoccus sp.]